MKALPLWLTLFRLAIGPALAALILWAASVLYRDPLLAGFIYALAFVLFALAALTDWLDGWIARKYDAVTALGAALDHTADKVLITCVLVALAYAALPLSLVGAAIIILARDVVIAGLRGAGRDIPVSSIAKWKATAAMAGVGAFLAFQAAALLNAPASAAIGLDIAARVLLWAAAALALISAVQYLAALRKPA